MIPALETSASNRPNRSMTVRTARVRGIFGTDIALDEHGPTGVPGITALETRAGQIDRA
jgi:hypothetical protein